MVTRFRNFIGGLCAAALAFAALAVAFIIRTVAEPFASESWARPAVAGGAPLQFDAPPAHQLRHEAGVSRRSAARHI